MLYIFFIYFQEVIQKVKVEQEELTKTLLQRIFPEIKVSEKSHDQWLKVFEEKVNTALDELKKKDIVDVHSELEKQNKSLQDMVSHYKQIIDDTVSFFVIFVFSYFIYF